MPLSHNSHVSECELTHTAIARDGACLLQALGLTVPDKPLVAADEVSPCHPSRPSRDIQGAARSSRTLIESHPGAARAGAHHQATRGDRRTRDGSFRSAARQNSSATASRAHGLVADANGSQSACDGSTVDRVPIPDQLAWDLIPGKRFSDLLRNPFCRRAGRHIDPHPAGHTFGTHNRWPAAQTIAAGRHLRACIRLDHRFRTGGCAMSFSSISFWISWSHFSARTTRSCKRSISVLSLLIRSSAVSSRRPASCSMTRMAWPD
jgi:hypothetical protein